MKRNWRGSSDENHPPNDRLSGQRGRSRSSTDRSSIPRPTPKVSNARVSGSGGVSGMGRFYQNRPTGENPSQKRSQSVGRTSIATGALSGPNRMRSSSSHQQGIGQGVRRSSGGLGSSKPLADSRNLTDKAMRQQYAKELVNFLMDRSYPHPIELRDVIQGPSATDFWRYFEFVYQILDEAFRFKTNDDKSAIFLETIKSIGYPFNVAPSHLKTIGSPHSWPYLLGVLHWMIGPIKAAFNSNAGDLILFGGVGIGGESTIDPLKKAEWDFITETYDAFMDGQDDMEEFKFGYHEKIKKLVHGPDGDAHALKAELDSLTRKKEAIASEADPLEDAKRSVHMLEEDRAKLEKHVRDKSDYAEKLKNMVANFESEITQLKKQTSMLSEEKKRLSIVYDAQDLTPADLQKINLERTQLRQRNKDALKQKEDLSQQLGDRQMEIAKYREETDRLVNEFNARTREARLVPETGENAFGNDLSLDANATNSSDIHGRLKVALLRVKKALQDDNNKLEMEIIDQKEALDDWDYNLKMKLDEVLAKERRLETLEREFDEKKRKMAAEVEAYKRKEEEEAEAIAALRTQLQTMNHAEVEIKDKVQREQQRMQQNRRMHEAEIESLGSACVRICSLAIQHKEKITALKRKRLEGRRELTERLEATKARRDKARREFEEMVNRVVAETKEVAEEALKSAEAAQSMAESALKEHEDKMSRIDDEVTQTST